MIQDYKDREEQLVGHINENQQKNLKPEQRPFTKWEIVYADEMPAEKTKGMGPYGFEINKPFYVQSAMWLEKTWYLHDNQHIYIRDRLDQTNKMYQRNKWFYDLKSKTMRSTDWNKDRWAVDSRGALRMHDIDSRWY